MTEFDSNAYLIPATLATGASTDHEAMLMLAYQGIGTILDSKGKHGYLRLPTAISWNEAEAKDGSIAETEFRLALLKELKAINSSDTKFLYSDELMRLRNKAFKP